MTALWLATAMVGGMVGVAGALSREELDPLGPGTAGVTEADIEEAPGDPGSAAPGEGLQPRPLCLDAIVAGNEIEGVDRSAQQPLCPVDEAPEGVAEDVAENVAEDVAQGPGVTGPVVVDDLQVLPEVEVLDPHVWAPTASLRTLANALVVKHKGAQLQVSAPAGLNVGTMEISVFYGGRRVTRNYDNVAGSRLTGLFPLGDGRRRHETVQISLMDRNPGGPYSYGFMHTLVVEPLFDIVIAPLGVMTGKGCDPFGSWADASVFWADPTGELHRYDAPGDQAAFIMEAFAGGWYGVGIDHGLSLPTIEWVDRDPVGFGSVGENALPRGPQIQIPIGDLDALPSSTPRTTRRVSETHRDADGDGCVGTFSYSITYTVRTYGTL